MKSGPRKKEKNQKGHISRQKFSFLFFFFLLISVHFKSSLSHFSWTLHCYKCFLQFHFEWVFSSPLSWVLQSCFLCGLAGQPSCAQIQTQLTEKEKHLLMWFTILHINFSSVKKKNVSQQGLPSCTNSNSMQWKREMSPNVVYHLAHQTQPSEKDKCLLTGQPSWHQTQPSEKEKCLLTGLPS